MNSADNVKEIKMVENGAIIIVLFVIIIFLAPSLISIISKTLKTSAELSSRGAANMAKELYTTINLNEEAGLPFKVVYNSKGYTIYSCGEKFTPINPVKVEVKGKLPKDGSVTINLDGTIVASNLKFGLFKCNIDANDSVTCKI